MFVKGAVSAERSHCGDPPYCTHGALHMTSLIGAQDSELKPVYDAFAQFGKHAKGEATFASKE